MQIRTVKESNSTVSNNYEENSLRAEVLKYKEKYDNKYKELEKAEEKLEQERESSTKNDGECFEETKFPIEILDKLKEGTLILYQNGKYQLYN